MPKVGARKIAQQLRALALSEVLGLVPRQPSVSLVPGEFNKVCIHTHRRNIHTHKTNLKIKINL